MTSFFPPSPVSRRDTIQVFQVDHGSVFDGILAGCKTMPGDRRRRPSLVVGTSSLGGSSHSSSSSSSRSYSPRPKSPMKSVKAKLALSHDEKKHLVVGSALVSPKKKNKPKVPRRSSVKQGIQQYFTPKKV